ncbi:thiopeptide-type bacteriocin biosynthesis protein [Actinoplanes aureus]|uniref:Thiopeptide-type bacteriocin biosynthesis protein n=1 Tax=Actinoplanes aureus TaxID=2792083 RepID=A0A931CID6_9ACTN|nr:thiopeptide-type bacteriocin biosynthesis protein [Actinoplanes aureus]MBG0569149.1 thiopeptide-type bacteriocin biosynthesis protein [Actinoplanes aureus]
MSTSAWHQTDIGFTDHCTAEQSAATHVIPILATAEARGLISAWSIVRKGTQWRLRYRPTRTGADAPAGITASLTALCGAGHLTKVVDVIYEPETEAFGGPRAMRIAHRLWHLDSRHLLTARPDQPSSTRRREMSILLCTTMMRAAGLDWYEQGAVWAQVAKHRDPVDPDHVIAVLDAVRRLLTVAPESLTAIGASLAADKAWINAFATTGAAIRRIHDDGHLQRGLRDVLAHHIIFAWNRHGVRAVDQAALATAAQTVVFGPDPTASLTIETAATR